MDNLSRMVTFEKFDTALCQLQPWLFQALIWKYNYKCNFQAKVDYFNNSTFLFLTQNRRRQWYGGSVVIGMAVETLLSSK